MPQGPGYYDRVDGDLVFRLFTPAAGVAAGVNDVPDDGEMLVWSAQKQAYVPRAQPDYSGAYVPFIGAASYTYNTDGSVATATEGGIVTTYTYNADGSVHTATRSGVTVTYSYNADGTVASVA